MANEARNHHFVPIFLLKSWLHEANSQNVHYGYYWDEKCGELKIMNKGSKGFCFKRDLLTLKSHNLGLDVIERNLSKIDDKAAKVCEVLIEKGLKYITVEQRCDFARFISSLVLRQPDTVKKLDNACIVNTFREGIDSDPKILSKMKAEKIKETPSAYYEKYTEASFDDMGRITIPRLVDNKKFGEQFINAHWGIRYFGEYDGSFVLADRPLIRHQKYNQSGAAWLLPLTPKVAFIAVNYSKNLEFLQCKTGQRFVKIINVLSAKQANQFVFSVDSSHEHWLGKYLASQSKQENT